MAGSYTEKDRKEIKALIKRQDKAEKKFQQYLKREERKRKIREAKFERAWNKSKRK